VHTLQETSHARFAAEDNIPVPTCDIAGVVGERVVRGGLSNGKSR
jgi:hypothetical protein